mgnify:CR=1 FL=1
MRFVAKEKKKADIPTGSMADISFLLLLFFMVTTIFRAETGLDVNLPKAEEGRKLSDRGIVHVYVNSRGTISIDDQQLETQQVSMIMSKKMQVDPSIIVSLRIDKDAKYDKVGDVFDQLSEAKALRVSLATQKMRG